jgi:hypothetical protein
MMGGIGPVPKRSDERIRRNKPDRPIEKVSVLGVVKIPDLGLDDPHDVTADLYQALLDSAQSKYFEPSDWAYARFCLHFADKLLKQARPSGQVLATVHSMLSDLLVSEGSRRRFRIEIERAESGTADNVMDIATLFKQRLSQS